MGCLAFIGVIIALVTGYISWPLAIILMLLCARDAL